METAEMYASSNVSRGTFDIAFLICCRPSEDVKRTKAENENMCGEEHLRNKLSFLLRPRHADFYARGYLLVGFVNRLLLSNKPKMAAITVDSIVPPPMHYSLPGRAAPQS